MKKKLGTFILAVIMVLMTVTITGCTGKSKVEKGTKENPFIIGVSPMTGWYAWYGIKETGIFEKNGVYVDIQFFPVYSDSLTAFYSGRVDGLVATSDIKDVEDLKGKKVATELGTVDHMFLLKMLEKHNMTIDDIEFTNMTINDAGPAFLAGSADAAVLWEPTLSMAISGGGNLITSSKETPGLIPDTFAVSDRVMKSSSSAVQKVVNSWFDGVELLNKRDKNFIQSIADDAELSYEEYEKK